MPRHLGGTEVRPEHKVCNREDGHRQTKIAAKIKRMRKKRGVDGAKPKAKKKIESRGFSKPAKKNSKLQWNWRLDDE